MAWRWSGYTPLSRPINDNYLYHFTNSNLLYIWCPRADAISLIIRSPFHSKGNHSPHGLYTQSSEIHNFGVKLITGLCQLIVRRAGLLLSQQDFEWRWSVPLFQCLTVLEFSFILFDLCLLITFFNFIMNNVPIVTFWIFTYHKIWILSIMFCFIWSYWIIYFLACL